MHPTFGAELATALIASALDAIIVTTLDGVVVAWNPAAARRYDSAGSRAIGRPFECFAPPGAADDLRAVLARVGAGEPVEPFDALRRRRDGGTVDASVAVSPVLGPGGTVVGVAWVERDVTGRRHVERMINHLAFHDSLTGLANRALLLDRLQNSLDRSRRAGGLVAVIYLDLDDFKEVNDRLGHPAGDRVLQTVAARLRGALRPEDTLARIGGDEFVAVSDGVPSPEAAWKIAERLVAALDPPVDFDAARVEITASAGVAVGAAGAEPEHLVAAADRAMYAAKTTGGDAIAASPQAPTGGAPDSWEAATRAATAVSPAGVRAPVRR